MPDVLNDGPLMSGTAGKRPVASSSFSGMYYYETDTGLLKQCNDGPVFTWSIIGPGTGFSSTVSTLFSSASAGSSAAVSRGDHAHPGRVLLTSGTLSGTSFTVSGLSTAYSHLHVMLAVRDTSAGTSITDTIIQFNSDTATNYSFVGGVGFGTTWTVETGGSQTGLTLAGCANGAATANFFAITTLLIPFYSNVNMVKQVQAMRSDITGMATGAPLNWRNRYGVWNSTAAISSITFKIAGGLTFDNNSFYSIYGEP